MTSHYSRAESIAIRVREKYSLSVGFDIFDFASSKFAVSIEDMPEGIDGLCVKSGGETQLYINKGKADTRKRFTLGHELGHHYIPWHIGERACDIDGDITILNDDEFSYKQQEGEANAFSSELLCPLEFLESTFDCNTPLVSAFHELEKTGLSVIAKFISLKRLWDSRPFPKTPKILCIFKNGVCENSWQIGSGLTHNIKVGVQRKDIVCSLDNVTSLAVSNSISLVEFSMTPGEFSRLPAEGRKYGKELGEILIAHNVNEADRLVRQISGKIGCRVSGIARQSSPQSILNAVQLKLKADHESILKLPGVEKLIADWVMGR